MEDEEDEDEDEGGRGVVTVCQGNVRMGPPSDCDGGHIETKRKQLSEQE